MDTLKQNKRKGEKKLSKIEVKDLVEIREGLGTNSALYLLVFKINEIIDKLND